VRQKVAAEAGVAEEELASDAEGLAEALDELQHMHKRRHAAASILQVTAACLLQLKLNS
jgi:hypothetical protein